MNYHEISGLAGLNIFTDLQHLNIGILYGLSHEFEFMHLFFNITRLHLRFKSMTSQVVRIFSCFPNLLNLHVEELSLAFSLPQIIAAIANLKKLKQVAITINSLHRPFIGETMLQCSNLNMIKIGCFNQICAVTLINQAIDIIGQAEQRMLELELKCSDVITENFQIPTNLKLKLINVNKSNLLLL
ncbi:hypothetical protein B4U79_18452 [Dinothrombium tinctorium]|uniref:Uncharacterized protein n=1 Tax=Dinothrombium tinctorium TaxID=1965070 RepID=A0A443QJ07_9ACAR|nr:hypothetical protein B4U79_18452 [Dinothrombium tinctorium]